MKTGIKKWTMALIAPVFFVLLVEGFLAITGWIQPLRLLQQYEYEGTRYWVTNPLYGRSVFPQLGAPMPSQIWLPVEKPAGVKRVVLIGESAAQGFPNSDFGLARILEAAWELTHPDHPLQVVDLTMTGVNSHYLRLFVKESLRLDPDQLVLFFGNNEYIGPYGPAAVVRDFQRSRIWIRLAQSVRMTRTGQAMDRIGRMVRPTKSNGRVWRGLSGAKKLDPNDPRLSAVQRSLDRNLKEMLSRAAADRVPVLIAVPAVNLTDWPPMASAEPMITDDAAALEAWRAGQPNALSSAIQAYRLAHARAAADDWPAAWSLFRLACDLDLYRFRADSAVRESLYRMAAAQGVSLVDTDRYVHEDHPDFTSDAAYFLEHVHFTFAGRVRVVEPILHFLEQQWRLVAANTTPRSLDLTQMAERLLFTDQLAAEMWMDVGAFYDSPTFRQQPGAEERMRFIAEQAQLVPVWSTDPGRHAVIAAQARRLMQRHPADGLIPIVWGQHQVAFGDNQSALASLRQGLRLLPRHYDAWLNVLNLSIADGNWSAAEEALSRLQEWAPDLPAANTHAGRLYAVQGRHAEAWPHFRRATLVRPGNATGHFQLAMCLDALGRYEEAVLSLRRSLELDPSNPLYASSLSWILVTKTDVDPSRARQAVSLAEAAVRQAPAVHRFHGVLAVAYAASGEAEKAHESAEVALSLARQRGDLEASAQLQAELARHGIELGR